MEKQIWSHIRVTKKAKKTYKLTTFGMPEPDIDNFRDVCKNEGKTMSGVIKQLIAEWMVKKKENGEGE